MNDTPRHHEATLSATKARQGATPGVVRWVLWISLALTIIALLVAYVAALTTPS
jgi:hypothetical protein